MEQAMHFPKLAFAVVASAASAAFRARALIGPREARRIRVAGQEVSSGIAYVSVIAALELYPQSDLPFSSG
jgi:hypothetical protein